MAQESEVKTVDDDPFKEKHRIITAEPSTPTVIPRVLKNAFLNPKADIMQVADVKQTIKNMVKK